MPSRQDTAALLPHIWLLGAEVFARAQTIVDGGTDEQVASLHVTLSNVVAYQDSLLRSVVSADPQFNEKLSSVLKTAASKVGHASDIADIAAAESLLAS